MNRDIYQKIAEKSNDKTALSILATNREMNKDIYYSVVFGKRYPDLIKYREEDESIKHLYLRMLEIIGKLKERFNYTYISGNPELQLKIFKESKGNINDLLINASRNGTIELVKHALQKGANIHVLGDLALVSASQKGDLEIVKYLVERGADVRALDDLALRWASANGHLEVVKVLVEKGANIHADNDLALKFASNNGHLGIVKYLKEQMKK